MAIEAMKKALEALLHYRSYESIRSTPASAAIFVLRQAIGQAEKEQADFQDFVAKVQEVEKQACEIINREWVGLTEDDLDNIWDSHCDELGDVRKEDASKIARAIEAKLKEKNHVD